MTYTHIRGIQNGDTVWVLTRHRSLKAAKRSTVSRPYLTGQCVILPLAGGRAPWPGETLVVRAGRAVCKPIP